MRPVPELADLLEGGVLVLDRELVIRGWNPWLAAASGMEAPTVVGRSLLGVFPGLVDGPAEAALQRALAGATTIWSQQFHGYLLPLAPPAGHEAVGHMQQSARILPLLRDGAVAGVLVLIDDVTERVVRERELRDALQRVEVASQAKSDFLASMSHELRTPLAAIVGYMDLLEGEMVGRVEPMQKTYLGRVRSAARHLISIIEEILTFSRVEAGKEPVRPELLDAAALARDAEALFEPQARHKHLELAIELPTTPVPVISDATKLRQILINLLGNAVKFTDTGRVVLALAVHPDRVVFTVRDSGPGIDPADLERIFDPFTQVDQSLKRTKGGTGLGLPVSRRLAELLGGELTVASTRGEGTTFTLSLPVETPARAGTAEALSQAPAATPP